jgi:hypothetical protein
MVFYCVLTMTANVDGLALLRIPGSATQLKPIHELMYRFYLLVQACRHAGPDEKRSPDGAVGGVCQNARLHVVHRLFFLAGFSGT